MNCRQLAYETKNVRRCAARAAGALLSAFLLTAVPVASGADGDIVIDLKPEALVELAPLAFEAFQIQQRAAAREAKHNADLASRGIAEIPASGSQRYKINTGGLSSFALNEWGEFYIDRRFVTDDEMQTVKAIEAWIGKWFRGHPSFPKPSSHPNKSRAGLPVFRGFEDARYQEHDDLIRRLTDDFNAHKAEWCGGTDAQAAKVPDITAALVKAHMIEETGGNDPSSKAAWAVDPLQVNVPGDWGAEKELVGLKKPSRRNEGTPDVNVKAAIKYLSRKGFGVSGKPASTRPSGFFDGWAKALQRYNGRRDRTHTNRHYSDEYADKIVRRAKNPDMFVPIEIKLAKKSPSEKGSVKEGGKK